MKYTYTAVDAYLKSKEKVASFILATPFPISLLYKGNVIEYVRILDDYIYFFNTLDTLYIDLLKSNIPFMIKVKWSSGTNVNLILFKHTYTDEKKLCITKHRDNMNYSKHIKLTEYEKELIKLAEIMNLV